MANANLYKLRCTAIQRQAQALAANLWWVINDGWTAVDGGSLAQGQIIEYRGSKRDTGRFFYRTEIKHKFDDYTVVIYLEMDVFSGEYRDALSRLEAWERDAVAAYLKRQPVAAHTKTEFERKNPDRHATPRAPLYLSPPDLEESRYTVQLSAFVQLAAWLLEPPKIVLCSKD